MDLNNAAQILVIILAGVLAIFLVLAIVVVIKFIEVLNHLKKITEKAERLADKAESVGEFFKYTAGPAAIGKLFSNVADVVMKNRKKGD